MLSSYFPVTSPSFFAFSLSLAHSCMSSWSTALNTPRVQPRGNYLLLSSTYWSFLSWILICFVANLFSQLFSSDPWLALDILPSYLSSQSLAVQLFIYQIEIIGRAFLIPCSYRRFFGIHVNVCVCNQISGTEKSSSEYTVPKTLLQHCTKYCLFILK